MFLKRKSILSYILSAKISSPLQDSTLPVTRAHSTLSKTFNILHTFDPRLAIGISKGGKRCQNVSQVRSLEAKSYILKIYQLTLHVLEQIFQKHYLNPFLRTPCYFLNMSSDCLWHIDKVRLLWCNVCYFLRSLDIYSKVSSYPNLKLISSFWMHHHWARGYNITPVQCSLEIELIET